MLEHVSYTRNMRWNLLGMVIPILVALFTIPPLIRGLGTERFGLLAIGWLVMGYFALFDFGLGRATTKFAAEYIARNDLARLPDLIWNSLAVHAALGLCGTALLFALIPWLTGGLFNIPDYLQFEARYVFYLMAISVPLIVIAACLRGMLEAFLRFDLVNYIKIPANVINYVAPLIVISFTQSLIAVVGVIVACRALVLAAHVVLCFRVLPSLVSGFRLNPRMIRPLFSFGGWLTVSSLISPFIMFLDRFFVATLFTLAAVTFYVTPYEVVTKLWVFSASLLAALFPVFSAMSVEHPHELRPLCRHAVHYLLFLVAPLVMIILVFGRELLEVWLGHSFAVESTATAKWLAVGVLVNVLAQVPYTVLQASGRADIVAKLQLVQLPFYAALAWWLARIFGATGIAIAWSLRAVIDAMLLSLTMNRLLPGQSKPLIASNNIYTSCVVFLFLLLSWIIDSKFRFDAANKVLPFLVVFAAFVLWLWFHLLSQSEHAVLKDWFRQMLKIGTVRDK